MEVPCVWWLIVISNQFWILKELTKKLEKFLTTESLPENVHFAEWEKQAKRPLDSGFLLLTESKNCMIFWRQSLRKKSRKWTFPYLENIIPESLYSSTGGYHMVSILITLKWCVIKNGKDSLYTVLLCSVWKI